MLTFTFWGLQEGYFAIGFDNLQPFVINTVMFLVLCLARVVFQGHLFGHTNGTSMFSILLFLSYFNTKFCFTFLYLMVCPRYIELKTVRIL